MTNLRMAGVVVVSLVAGLAGSHAAVAEESAAKKPEPPPEIADPSKTPVPTVKELETEIKELRAPIDHQQVGMLFYNVSRIDDTKEQERLRKLLNDRMLELMQVPSSLGSAPTDEELKKKIETVNLDPHAPAEDIKAKEDLVAAIMAIPDTERRERMLKELEWRELGAHTAVYAPASTKPTTKQ